MIIYDTIIIGGGQAGLSVAYFLRRSSLEYLILDNQKKPGGAWLETWESLQLFSPTQFSSISGWQMPKSKGEYPTKKEFIDYLNAYQERYDFPVQRNTAVIQVEKESGIFKIVTNRGVFHAKTVVSTTGTAKNPFVPNYPNQSDFEGTQLHSVEYRNPMIFNGKKVLVVGGGNSGAQILSEVSKVAEAKWVTLEPPQFMPEDIDGRYLFNQANSSYLDNNTQNFEEEVSLSDIVQVESVKEGLKRGIYKAVRPFHSFYKHGVIWQNGEKEVFHAVIWCTGFRANLQHLEALNIIEDNRVKTKNTRSLKEPNLWLVGYGKWTGFASATIYGVGKTARATANEIRAHFKTES
ncbi:putative oxidoreductase CzcO [Arenibacter antarcticus]|uniref:ArsO family NAD(P)H-dependent flavin-containing monooxygenase n=1 Tax=Arenibacter antarcticus TaxID=2040469 RepID=A0ABW5VH60_9FLAO|nr:ArsO family NAD(P)H-dependent flavin-containing monooxygenase [Arenibacter sp. H213]MCM4166325.1 pyridine nucleotide-disulfide oxidoreductase [Arenibacter sp. H213]